MFKQAAAMREWLGMNTRPAEFLPFFIAVVSSNKPSLNKQFSMIIVLTMFKQDQNNANARVVHILHRERFCRWYDSDGANWCQTTVRLSTVQTS